jgi:regulator of cell morphogenesis and NO signaling
MYVKHNQVINADMKMSDIILNNHYIILMLEHFGIDPVVQEKTVREICRENKISEDVFLSFANLFNGARVTNASQQPAKDFNFEDLQTIINFLDKGHKYYLEEKYPKIENYIQQLTKINKQAEILMVKKFFDDYIKEVKEHLNYESEIVFPYMIALSKKESKVSRKDAKTQSTIKDGYSVKQYKEQHDDIEEKLADLKNLLIKYLPSKNDWQIRRKLLFSLFELEYDLNIHSQIEDKILIPLAERMEKRK